MGLAFMTRTRTRAYPYLLPVRVQKPVTFPSNEKCDRCDGLCDGLCYGRRLSQEEGVTEVWLFGMDSFEECPLTEMSEVTTKV